MLKKEYPEEYLRLNEWVLNQYRSLIQDENLFSKFTIYIGQNAGSFPIPEELKTTIRVYRAAHKYSSTRELEIISVVNEKERLGSIEKDLQAEIQPYLDLEGLQKLITHQKAFDFLLKIEQLRFQTRWNQTPRVPQTSVLGHCFFVAIMTLLLGRESNPKMCERRVINNFFSALFHDLPEAVTRDIISPVKQATDDLPNIVKKIENEINNAIIQIYGEEKAPEIYDKVMQIAKTAIENRPEDLRKEDLSRTEDWYKDEIIYMFYVDQFGGYVADFGTYMEAYSLRSEQEVKDIVSYVEFDFYNKVDLIRYFMRCENVDVSLINTLHERLLKNIEILYYLTSPSKKMLKDMGIYDGDIDQIIAVIGEDFTSIAELQHLLTQHFDKLGEISIVSRYIIERLIK